MKTYGLYLKTTRYPLGNEGKVDSTTQLISPSSSINDLRRRWNIEVMKKQSEGICFLPKFDLSRSDILQIYGNDSDNGKNLLTCSYCVTVKEIKSQI